MIHREAPSTNCSNKGQDQTVLLQTVLDDWNLLVISQMSIQTLLPFLEKVDRTDIWSKKILDPLGFPLIPS